MEDLAEYTSRLTEVFEKNGTHGTWYAHASVGCLHVRPVINLKEEDGARKMRAIAEEAFSMVREYKGSHSGEHGDGLVRSEFHNKMFGKRIVKDFEYIKDIFDPKQFLNPGKIVRSPKMDDRSLFRFKPDYKQKPIDTVLDWSEWGSFASATEMCNNNGACRKKDANVMCPSFRATGDEKDLTRGRANTLRLALSGQLGKDALVSDEMADTMALCVSCKGCKRECPTGVDIARMKIEFLHHYKNRHGFTLRDRLIAYLPAYAPYAAKLPWLINSRNWIPGAALLAEAVTGISSRRQLPRWRTDWFRTSKNTVGPSNGPQVLLLADVFNSYFEPENLQSAVKVLTGAGYRVHILGKDNGHPLDDGRTLLATGMIRKAKKRIQEM
ncbi:MAG: FAD-linked oxidase C-terminal domain-containing protein, partial [Pseudomonadota bacterium]|nr:FAD-linked oxidase C-terminal domain-containing protein [Pseudomonadota bacterium]